MNAWIKNAATAGALLFLSQIHAIAYGSAILPGMFFCPAGS